MFRSTKTIQPLKNVYTGITYFSVIVLAFYVAPAPVMAQQPDFVTSLQDAADNSESCAMQVNKEDAHVSIRVLPYSLTAEDVDVEIAFKMDELSPCLVEKTTPAEMHFAEGTLSLMVTSKDSTSHFRLAIPKHGEEPAGGTGTTNKACFKAIPEGVIIGCGRL